METKMARYWINAPSELQSEHGMHGTRVVAPDSLPAEGSVTVYFSEAGSPLISAVISPSVLSRGWPGEPAKNCANCCWRVKAGHEFTHEHQPRAY